MVKWSHNNSGGWSAPLECVQQNVNREEVISMMIMFGKIRNWKQFVLFSGYWRRADNMTISQRLPSSSTSTQQSSHQVIFGTYEKSLTNSIPSSEGHKFKFNDAYLKWSRSASETQSWPLLLTQLPRLSCNWILQGCSKLNYSAVYSSHWWLCQCAMPYSSFVVCQDVRISLGWIGTDFLINLLFTNNKKVFKTSNCLNQVRWSGAEETL